MPKQTIHKARNFNLVFNPGLETTRTSYLPINPTQSINAHANESESGDDKRMAA